jgi:hypothetical protein
VVGAAGVVVVAAVDAAAGTLDAGPEVVETDATCAGDAVVAAGLVDAAMLGGLEVEVEVDVESVQLAADTVTIATGATRASQLRHRTAPDCRPPCS